MSRDYAGSNGETAMNAFYKKFMYTFDTRDRSLGYSNLVNFGFAEKALYGRVNIFYVPIMLNTSAVPLKNSSLAIDGANSVRMPAFVDDAFKDLTTQFRKSLFAGKISADEEHLSTLVVHKAYEDPKLLYGRHLESVLSGIRRSFRKNNVQFEDFDAFMVQFMGAVGAVTKRFPYTFPGYIKHRLCPINASGLAIEIADMDFSNDDEKMEQFVKSRNWKFYLNACRSYGFSVDMKAPWRLVADIGSSEMLKYSRKYGYPSTDSILSMAYKLAHLEYYDGFKRALLYSYNSLKLETYLKVTYCNDGTTIPKVIRPKNYTMEDIEKRYNEEYFLRAYLNIRLLEEESKFTTEDQKTLLEDTVRLYRTQGAEKALGAFERIIGRTGDYSGSLTTYERRAILTKEEEERERELKGAVSTYR